jgi:hypothetical protein
MVRWKVLGIWLTITFSGLDTHNIILEKYVDKKFRVEGIFPAIKV